ncbi:phosphoribosyl transferase, partial [Paenarthrobacter sp. CM16]|nr:phosphoribosyl transferase [Paenarthrobacter sp. CM16]
MEVEQMGMRFKDRAEAGRRLAEALPQLREQPDT